MIQIFKWKLQADLFDNRHQAILKHAKTYVIYDHIHTFSRISTKSGRNICFDYGKVIGYVWQLYAIQEHFIFVTFFILWLCHWLHNAAQKQLWQCADENIPTNAEQTWTVS